MTKEELKQEAEEWLNEWELCNKCDHKAECIEEHSYCHLVVNRAYIAGAEPREKRISELEEKISVLLSCKNCPENKGGYICEKEYENKCLTQKIQFIKELQEEIAELKDKLKNIRRYLELINEATTIIYKMV